MRSIVRKTIWTLTLILVVPAGSLYAAVEPGIDVADMVAKSDVIVVGRVIDMGDTGRAPADPLPGPVAGYVLYADVAVLEVLRGPSTLTWLRFRFQTAELVTQYRGIAPGAVRMFFLTASGMAYDATSHYYPSLPAQPGRVSGSTPLDRVVAALSRPLTTAGASPALKHEVIRTLWFTPAALSVPRLRSALKDADESVRLAATAALLYNDDASVLPIAEALLLAPSAPIHALVRQNITAAIENGVKSPAAVPVLRRLLQRGDPTTRRAASAALGRTGSRAALDALVRGLDDDDVDVRINSVRGLAHVTGRSDRIPSRDAFRVDELSNINFWKEWAHEQGVEAQ